MSQIRIAAAALGLLLLGGSGIAEAAPIHRTRGTVVSITSSQITVLNREGATVSFAITGDTHAAGERTVSINAIQAGSYIGSAAVPAGDGKLRALEVTVFPPAMKGVGEGSYAWDLTPSSSMTNGTVGNLVVSNGNTMTVDYKGGQKTIIVPADVPIVTIDPGSLSNVKPGTKVIVIPTKGDATTADRVIYGENGIAPPQ
jgi:hypothetical protein